MSEMLLSIISHPRCSSQKDTVTGKDGVAKGHCHAVRSMPWQVISDPFHRPQLDGLVVKHEPVKAALIIGRAESVSVSEPKLYLDNSRADIDWRPFG
jgi:hypothetical protein